MACGLEVHCTVGAGGHVTECHDTGVGQLMLQLSLAQGLPTPMLEPEPFQRVYTLKVEASNLPEECLQW